MRNPVITLLTDFGTKDHYVASMKGVILKINPRCRLIDITHEVSPHDIREGAFILANAYSYFPEGTIHLSVVDPGVGGTRKPILLVTPNYCFVGPDNGLFTIVAQKERVKQIIALDEQKYHLSKVSATFHGRDIFAPAAGHLSLGVHPGAFGHEIESLSGLKFEGPFIREGKLLGGILHIDTFGNLVSNIDEEGLFRFARKHPFVIRAGGKTIRGLKRGYWEGKKGELIALLGSGGFLEISVREGNAQRALKAKRGDPVEISTKFQASNPK
ncbi:MAG TPA: SAM-dependent chlorinase/fluorinase [Thermodesulfobacteriota bacterium]|nr:SAM-dependent chlorinase/fluorinase [Thermodesulfobacteriota bacterium]